MLFREDLKGSTFDFHISDSLNQNGIIRDFFCKTQVSECNLCLFVEFGNWEIHVFLNLHHFPCIVWKEIWISPFWGNFITKFLPYLKYRGNVADTPVKRSDIQSKSKHLKGRLEEACTSVSDVTWAFEPSYIMHLTAWRSPRWPM